MTSPKKVTSEEMSMIEIASINKSLYYAYKRIVQLQEVNADLEEENGLLRDTIESLRSSGDV